MRIAVVDGGVAEPLGAATLAGMLGRPVDSLAHDLAELGHVVHHLRSRTGDLRSVDDVGGGRPRPGRGPRSAVRAVDVSPGRELSVLRAFRPDAVLGIGAAVGRVLDDVMPGLRARWVWTPGREPLAPAGAEARWWPTSASRLVVASTADRDALAATGFPRSRCDVAAWHLASSEGVALAEEPRLVRTVLTAADHDGEGVADVVRSLVLLPGVRLVVLVDPATSRTTEGMLRWLALAAGLGVRDRVRLVRVGSAAEVTSLMADCGLLVTVPRRVPQLELVATAMRNGIPVVASDHDAVRAFVETGCTGLLLPAGDVRRLGRALHVIRRDASSRTQWVRAARLRGRELLSPEGTSFAVAQALTAPEAHGDVGYRTVGGSASSTGFGRAATG